MVCEEKPQVPEEPQQTPPEEPQETPSKESEEASALAPCQMPLKHLPTDHVSHKQGLQ